MNLINHFAFLVGCTFLFACGGDRPASSSEGPAASTAATVDGKSQSIDGDSQQGEAQTAAAVELIFPEGGAPLNEHFSMQVKVSGIAPDQVVADADMPAHGHGMLSTPVTKSLGDGLYQVDGMLLHMPGEWVIFVEVTRDGVTERTEHPLTLDFTK